MTTSVAYLTGEYPRATDTWIQREVDGLRARGVDVHTFAARRTGDEHMVGPEQIAERAGTVYLVPRLGSLRLLADHARSVRRSPSRYGATLRLMWRTRATGRTFRQLAYFLEAGLLAGELDRRDLRHVHAHFGQSSCTIAMLAAELRGCTFSFTVHGPTIFAEAESWAVPEKLRRAEFCVAISELGRRRLLALVEPGAADVHVVHCGVAVEGRPQAVHRGPGRRLVFVGRLDESKGVHVLLAALARIAPELPGVHLVVIGDGPERGRLQAQARRLGLASSVAFEGFRSRSEVVDAMSTADVLVLSSFAEGIPVTIMEAFASGVPVVATSVGAVGELVDDGVNGFIVEPGDASALAERLIALINDPGTRARFGSAGRQRVAADFDPDEQVRRLHALFERVLSAPDGARGQARSST